jgi:hypothetical protein
LVTRFLHLAEMAEAAGADYDFVVTGDLGSWGLPRCKAVSFAGFVEDLPEFMGRCRAIAMLSPLGYGFKTTIGDALAAGARVLAHPGLVRRCPSLVRPHLIPLDSQELDTAWVMQRLAELPQGVAVHTRLKGMNHAMMDHWFGPGREMTVSRAMAKHARDAK